MTDPKEEASTTSEEMAYNYTYLPPVAMADKVPFPGFSLGWLFLAVIQALRIFLNKVANTLTAPIEDIVEELDKLEKNISEGHYFRGMLDAVALFKDIMRDLDAVKDLADEIAAIEKSFAEKDYLELLGQVRTFFKELEEIGSAAAPSGHASSLDEYNEMFRVLPLPEIANTFQTDESFAHLRVAGPNPLVISLYDKAEDKFPVTNDQYQAVMGSDDSFAAALEGKRLFIADYAIMDGGVSGSFPDEQKYLLAPMALFALPKDGGNQRRLKPIAVQCGQDPKTYPIITPPRDAGDVSGKVNWQMAKTVIECADGNYHEALSHLGRTHLVVEPFVVATINRLPDDHPISKLLTPHYEGTLLINNLAQKSLIAAGGTIDKIMSGTIDQSRIYGVKGAMSYQQDFRECYLRKTLANRRVLDPNVLPYYPYRDDGLEVWDAIASWTSDYVDIYFDEDSDVVGDTDLQDWLTELLSHNGGRMANIVAGDKFEKKSELKDTLTMVIFTASAAHAAVNFPQATIMSYTPAMPLANYTPPPTNQTLTEEDWMQQLPPLDMAANQLETGTLLGSVYYTRLGKYKKTWFKNPRVILALKKFQDELEKIEELIKQRDPNGEYPYLLPSQIPQSINI